MAKQNRILVGQCRRTSPAAPAASGRAIAAAFAREGMKVAIGDLDAELAERTAGRARRWASRPSRLDVTRRESFETFVENVEEQLGPLDVLVNNAGIMSLGRFLEESDESAIRMVDINLHGVIFGTKIALQRMVPRDRGHVVNVASQAGRYGAPGGATYSATKHAVIGLTEAIRGELHAEGSAVELSYVLPYVVNTELGAGTHRARLSRTSSPPRSPTRSWTPCATAPSRSGCRVPPGARTASACSCRARPVSGSLGR
jgi:NADP-dependent 3-hydroxy acid dehydrogenase YdfG